MLLPYQRRAPQSLKGEIKRRSGVLMGREHIINVKWAPCDRQTVISELLYLRCRLVAPFEWASAVRSEPERSHAAHPWHAAPSVRSDPLSASRKQTDRSSHAKTRLAGHAHVRGLNAKI